MTGRNLAFRLAKLEDARLIKPRPQWLYHVSSPPTAEELAAINAATHPHIIAPWPCKTVEEWVAKYAPKETMQ